MQRTTAHKKTQRPGLYLCIFFATLFLTGLIQLTDPVMGAIAETSSMQTLSREFTRITKEATPTVVYIEVKKSVEASRFSSPFEYNDPFDLFDDEFFERFFGHRFPEERRPKEYREKGAGSGFIISSDGYILSNHHVVGDADKITVHLKDGRDFKGKVVGSDPSSDIAIVKIDGDDNLPVLPLGDSDALEVGELVMAIGNPFGLTHTMTLGVVSAKGRTAVGITDYEDFIQTDAAINPGNSGGPLINMEGKAIGVNTAIYSRTGGYMGIGFAIPINMVKTIKNQLIDRGEVVRGYLGVTIQDLSEELKKSFDLEDVEGVLIAGVQEDSPADKAGIKRGDVVLEFNGKRGFDVGRFRNIVALTPPKTKVPVVVIRDGKKKTVTVKIGKLEKEMFSQATQTNLTKKLGLTVQNLTDELSARFGYEDEEGVLISDVYRESPAESAGLQPGMLILEVNRKSVESVDEFLKAINQSKNSKSNYALCPGQTSCAVCSH